MMGLLGLMLLHESRWFGAYTLQAAIAAVHAESSSVASTGWREKPRSGHCQVRRSGAGSLSYP